MAALKRDVANIKYMVSKLCAKLELPTSDLEDFNGEAIAEETEQSSDDDPNSCLKLKTVKSLELPDEQIFSLRKTRATNQAFELTPLTP